MGDRSGAAAWRDGGAAAAQRQGTLAETGRRAGTHRRSSAAARHTAAAEIRGGVGGGYIAANGSLTPEATAMQDKLSLDAAFARIEDHWNPRIAAELNGQQVKVVKVLGAFVWHSHEHEDELFLVHRGRLRLELRDRIVELGPGELFVVGRGVEHRPVADGEVELVLFEPASTLNTGNVRDARTRDTLERL